MKNLILLKADSLLLSVVSIVYGIQLISSPEIFGQYQVYELLATFANATMVGVPFLTVGLLKGFGVFTDNKLIKKYSLITLTLLWTILWVLFAIANVNNTINLLPFAMAVLSIIISVREVY